ncbi:GNAT family N-acetyltransferase, partial [Glycomyces tenuis]|uniref:GNAT family N-acetyltransferase n=1 Tax=Glycomyces tenuis TaxID=58116 RepID=UPI000557BFF5
MEPRLNVRKAEAADRERVAAAYDEASADEAVRAWLYGGLPLPPEMVTGYFAEFISRSIDEDEVWIAKAGDEVWGVAVWIEVHDVARFEAEADELAAVAEEHDLPVLRRGVRALRMVAAAHPRRYPHLYLHSIAVDPRRRGRGAGAALLAERLRLADEAGMPVYLEASTERSARLYERSGFTAEESRIAFPEDGPVLIPI